MQAMKKRLERLESRDAPGVDVVMYLPKRLDHDERQAAIGTLFAKEGVEPRSEPWIIETDDGSPPRLAFVGDFGELLAYVAANSKRIGVDEISDKDLANV